MLPEAYRVRDDTGKDMSIISIEHLSKFYTERMLFEDADFSMQEGEKTALIGINGTGKSTLLKIVAGLEGPDSGTVVRRRNLKIRFLPQNPVFHEGDTVLESILRDNGEYARVSSQDTNGSYEAADNHVWDLEVQAKTFLNRLGITDHQAKVETLSGGQRKRVALASVLLSSADLLVLDEPTNHLDGEMSEWLEQYLKGFRGSILMVTHDRYFLDSVTNRIVELDQGKLYSYQTNYAGYLELRAERLDMAQASERKRQSILRKELAWIRRGAQARTTKQKGRIQRYEALSAMEAPTAEEELALSSVSSRLGRTTVELENISKAYGSRQLLQDFTYIFLKQDRIGIIGPNGAGKSTLMKIIAGWEQPDAGSVTIGQTVKIGYFSQENEAMDESLRVIDYIRGAAEYIRTEDGSISASQMLERFLFPSSQQYTTIGKLSGGEKRRLYLLRILMEAPNVLLLDEPTNDLDIRTMTILEDYLDHFQGIVITVSHDRYFLDRIVRRIFALEGGGKVSQYEGGYTDYQVEYLRRHPELAVQIGTRTASGVKDGSITGNNKGSGTGAVSGAQKAGSLGGATGFAGGENGDGDTGKGWKKPRQEKLKFTYKEQKEWDSIEEDIAALEEDVAALDEAMSAVANDFVQLQKLAAEKEEKEAALLEKMDRWEYLSELKERIDGAQNIS